MGQEDGEKWTAAANLQPTISKSDRLLVSGDVDAGELTLEESINGTNISATWIGQVVAGSCGKEIRGTWNNAPPSPSAPSAAPTPFVLRKQVGWQ